MEVKKTFIASFQIYSQIYFVSKKCVIVLGFLVLHDFNFLFLPSTFIEGQERKRENKIICGVCW